MLYDRVKYELVYADNNFVPVLINEPKGWDEEALVYERNEKYHGIVVNTSSDLRYYGVAYTIIKGLFDTYGVSADLRLNRYVKNEDTDVWEIDFVGWCDFKTYREQKNSVTIKFNSDPLQNKFKSDNGTSLEVDRTTKLNGDEISRLVPSRIYIKGRPLYNYSALKMESQTKDESYLMRFGDGNFRTACLPYNLRITGQNDDPNVNDVIDAGNFSTTPQVEGIYRSFYSQADINRTLNVSISFDIDIWLRTSYDVRNGFYYIRLVKYNSAGDFVEEIDRYDYRTIPPSFDGILNTKASNNYVINIQQDESIAIEHYFGGNFGGFLNAAEYDIAFRKDGSTLAQTCSIVITENSQFQPGTYNFVLLKAILERFCDIAFNSKFESNLLTSGEFSGLGLIHGFWLRQMEAEADFKPLTTSLESIFSALNIVSPVGISITNQIRLESIDYFYQDFIAEDIGMVEDFEIYLNPSDYKTKIIVGYTKAEVDEEDGALDEYNSNTTYTTGIDGSVNELTLSTKLRADGDGIERARRTSIDKTKSTGVDSDVWLLDTVFRNNQYEMAAYFDHFESVPIGIYDPPSAMNLRLSPGNCLRRQGRIINSFLNNVPNKMLRYVSSVGNSDMITKPIGEAEVMENADVDSSTLDSGYYSGKLCKFTTANRFKNLKNSTNGVPNYYGLIQFKIDSRTTLYGFIQRIDKGKGTSEITLKLR